MCDAYDAGFCEDTPTAKTSQVNSSLPKILPGFIRPPGGIIFLKTMDFMQIYHNQVEKNYDGEMTERDRHHISDTDDDVIPTGLMRFNSKYKAYLGQDDSE